MDFLSFLGLLNIVIACMVASVLLVVRPWDGNTQRSHKLAQSTPYPMFWAVAWAYALAEWFAGLKPAPMRVAELANNYISSQVLFSLVRLGVPDALLSGPLTAFELAAAAVGPTANAVWLDRLLSAAAVLGMLKRSGVSISTIHARAAMRAAGSKMAKNDTASNQHAKEETASNQQAQNGTASMQQASLPFDELQCTSAGTGLVFEYSLNAVSAALTSGSPVNMSALVNNCADQYLTVAKLSKGICTSTIPHKLHTGGQDYWAWTFSDPARAARFDHAMVAVNHFGGSAAVNTYPWGQYDCVVDVAGGVGGFMADLLATHTGIKQGMVLDLPSNITRAQQIWSSSYPHLLPKVQLIAGDMFDAATIPAPPPGCVSTAYVLRNILHDWPDDECMKILKAVRSSVGSHAQATGRSSSSSSRNVRLLIVEMTTTEDVLPCHLPVRHVSDIVMLSCFGDARERNEQHFRSLLQASGWRLQRLTPTSGVFMVLEATPV